MIIPRTCRFGSVAVLICALCSSALTAPSVLFAQAPKDPPPVDQAKVDEAVGKAAEWLRGLLKNGLPAFNDNKDANHIGSTYDEIVLYALLHAGVNRGDPDLIKLVEEIRSKPPVHTYTGAMRAMAFEMYDPMKLRHDLMGCAQFLVDNQGKNGLWGYSHPVPLAAPPKVTFTPSKDPPKYTYSGPEGGSAPAPGPGEASAASPSTAPGKTMAKKEPPKVGVERRQWGEGFDHSNTQYAVLGLRACMAAGIMPPQDCLSLAGEWIIQHQNPDGGWGYNSGIDPGSYGSMTAGCLSGLSICLRAVHKDPQKDPRIQKGLEWMAKNFRPDQNPGIGGWKQGYVYYWLYGVERAGAIIDTEWFGDKPWYHDGAEWLLAGQNPDGSWNADGGPEVTGTRQILDTCWAILFLRRATKHIVRKDVFTH